MCVCMMHASCASDSFHLPMPASLLRSYTCLSLVSQLVKQGLADAQKAAERSGTDAEKALAAAQVEVFQALEKVAA